MRKLIVIILNNRRLQTKTQTNESYVTKENLQRQQWMCQCESSPTPGV